MLAKLLWKLVAGAAVVGTGLVVRKVLESGWERTTGSRPPDDPEAPETSWRQAIGWAAASGFAVATARLVARRTAAAGWRRATGHTPPGAGARAATPAGVG